MKRELRNGQEYLVWDSYHDILEHFDELYSGMSEPCRSILKEGLERRAQTENVGVKRNV
jgi:hypothetical protein